MKLKRYPKKVLVKYYASQVVMTQVVELDEPHKIVRCSACDEAKNLEFHRTENGEQYYKCQCGFQSQPLGKAPYPRKGIDIL